MKAGALRRLYVTLALVALPCADALGEIYKCVDAGKTSYQDQPCKGAATEKTLAPVDTKGITPTPSADDEKSNRLKTQVDEFARDRRKRELLAAIDRIERDLRDYDTAEATEVAALRDKRRYNENNPTAQPWEMQPVLKRIDDEIQSTADRYKALRQAARDRIAQLRKDAAGLEPPSAPKQ